MSHARHEGSELWCRRGQVVGVAGALFFTGATINLFSLMAVVMLVGIVVKNAIVLVDYINLMRARDLELREAIIVSGKSRLRPVLMTSLTTILRAICKTHFG